MNLPYRPEIKKLRDKWICSNCIGDAYLSRVVEDQGTHVTCSYCGNEDPCYGVGELSELVEVAFQSHFHRTSDQPDDLQRSMLAHRDSDYEWDRDGMPVVEVIESAAGVSDDVAHDVQRILERKYYDFESAKMGEETEFAADSYYEESAAETAHWSSAWDSFARSLREQARFFNDKASKYLGEVFAGIEDMRTWRAKTVIVEAGPDTAYSVLYRARVFQAHEALMAAIEHPDLHLGPPPSTHAAAGRMNAKGIVVFYGSTDPAVAIAEVRPPVGSSVAVAAFEFVRKVRLLDLTVFNEIRLTPSYFDPAFSEKSSHVSFLNTLCSRIARPVMPDDEATDYLATQAVADYLAARPEGIDGVLFPSVQAGGKALNVVLFHKAAKVMKMAFPADTKINANAWGYEDGSIEYSVSETVPKSSIGDSGSADDDVDEDSLDAVIERSHDPRDPTLRVQPHSVRVHEVRSVDFTTTRQQVRRYRRVAGDDKDF